MAKVVLNNVDACEVQRKRTDFRESQKGRAELYHQVLGKAVRDSLSNMTDDDIEEVRFQALINGSAWILVGLNTQDHSDLYSNSDVNYYDINQKILMFKKSVFNDVREVRKCALYRNCIQVRISNVEKFLQ